MADRVIVVIGAGPGVSGSVARRFAAEGYAAGLVGVDPAVLDELASSIDTETDSRVADITDATQATDAVRELGEHFGRIDVLHFNPSAWRQRTPLELTVPELLEDVTLGVGALLTTVQAARPFMAAGGRVTATGSMAADQPSPDAASLGVQKAGLRNLVHSLDATLRPDGIRAVSVTVRGTLSREGAFTPDRVAEAIHAAATRPDDDAWTSEVPYSG